MHCPHSESELCFFICSAQISLKFNCIKTPQRLSEVSLCKLQLLQLLQLYRRLVVKVEAHLKLKCTWQRLKLRPLLHSLFWGRWHHPAGSFQRERSALPGTFSYTAWLNLQKINTVGSLTIDQATKALSVIIWNNWSGSVLCCCRLSSNFLTYFFTQVLLKRVFENFSFMIPQLFCFHYIHFKTLVSVRCADFTFFFLLRKKLL